MYAGTLFKDLFKDLPVGQLLAGGALIEGALPLVKLSWSHISSHARQFTPTATGATIGCRKRLHCISLSLYTRRQRDEVIAN